MFLGEYLNCRFDVARRHLFGIQRERGTLPGNGGEFFFVHVNRDNDAAQGSRDLSGIIAARALDTQNRLSAAHGDRLRLETDGLPPACDEGAYPGQIQGSESRLTR